MVRSLDRSGNQLVNELLLHGGFGAPLLRHGYGQGGTGQNQGENHQGRRLIGSREDRRTEIPELKIAPYREGSTGNRMTQFPWAAAPFGLHGCGFSPIERY
jgi:hypothetical protein